jgi:tellurium resistance protein TerD
VADDLRTDLARFELTEDASTETAMVVIEPYHNGTAWRLRTIGRATSPARGCIAIDYGVNV